MRRSSAFRLVVAGLVALAVTLLAWAGLSAGTFQGTQLRFSDALFDSAGRSPDIAIVAIDDRSLQEASWPWPRSRHAEVIDALATAGASVIGYDVQFTEPQEPGEDQALAEAIGRAGNVVLAAGAQFEGTTQRLGDLGPTDVPRPAEIFVPIPTLAEAAAGVGHANVINDPDGVVRTVPPLIETPDFDLLPAISLAAYQLHQGLPGPYTVRPEAIDVNGRLIETSQGHLLDVNFTRGYPVYSAQAVLGGAVPERAFAGKVVLVGATAAGLGDVVDTPIQVTNREPGVFVHANALNTMLTGQFISDDSRVMTLLVVFALVLLVAVVVGFLRIWLSVLIAMGIAAGYTLLTFWRFDTSGARGNLVYPLFGVLLAYLLALAIRYLTEERERIRVTRVFGRYVAQDVVEEVLAAPEKALATLEGAERPLTMLFADLRGFTSASEGQQPADVVEALNVYLDAMTRAVNEELGTIDKFMGDCVMAFWGAPRPTEHHAERAVRAGIKMLDYIDDAVKQGKAAELKVKGCGVGIATGPAVVGNIGSAERLDYTVIGDTVNTASRICGVAGAGQVVVTEETKNALGDGFRVGPMPPLVVKGKVEPLSVYQVLREGQEAEEVAEGATLDATEDKGHFEAQTAPAKAASYAPVEPVTAPARTSTRKKPTGNSGSKKKSAATRKRPASRSRT